MARFDRLGHPSGCRPRTEASAPGRASSDVWPAESAGITAAGAMGWKVEAASWSLTLEPTLQRREGPLVQLVLTEHTAAIVDSEHWLHQASFWLYHEDNTDLYFRLPRGARVIAVALDDRELAPLQAEPERLWLPLPGKAGALRVRLTWGFAPGTEIFRQPNLDLPQVEGSSPGPVVWTVRIPAGSTVGTRNATGAVLCTPTGSARAELRRGEAQVQLCALLARRVQGNDSPTSQYLAAQQRFFRCCQRADYLLGSLVPVRKLPTPSALSGCVACTEK